MKRSAGFVAQIRGTRGSKEHGTGFLVSSKHVLTCAHVVFGVDDHSRIKWPDRTASSHEVRVIFRRPAKPHRCLGKVIAWIEPDLALIELDARVPEGPVSLLTGLEQGDFQTITKCWNAILGYQQKKRSLTRAAVRQAVFLTANEAGLLTVQIEGGISEGMSGSPSLVDVDGKLACWGMVYLGGDGASTSRLISSDYILRFLKRRQVPVHIVRADTSLFATPGAFLEKVCAEQHVTIHSVAATLGIPESVVEAWMKNELTPSEDSRRRLADLLGTRRATFKSELERRISKQARGRPRQDIISLLRGFPRGRQAELDFVAPSELGLRLRPHPGLLSSQRRVHGGYSARTTHLKGVATPPGYDGGRVFGIDSEKNIRVNLRQPAYVTFLDVTRAESEEREYWCLDSLLGIDQALPIGESLLPLDGRTVPIRGPLGYGCLIMLARESKPFRWNGQVRQGLTKVAYKDLLKVMNRLRSPVEKLHVGWCEYRVID